MVTEGQCDFRHAMDVYWSAGRHYEGYVGVGELAEGPGEGRLYVSNTGGWRRGVDTFCLLLFGKCVSFAVVAQCPVALACTWNCLRVLPRTPSALLQQLPLGYGGCPSTRILRTQSAPGVFKWASVTDEKQVNALPNTEVILAAMQADNPPSPRKLDCATTGLAQEQDLSACGCTCSTCNVKCVLWHAFVAGPVKACLVGA